MSPNSRLSARPYFAESDLPGILAEMEAVLRSGRLILGPQTEALECEFAARTGTQYAVAVSSCTAALEIALRAIGANGREVVVPTNTFTATATAALRATRGVSRGILVPTNTCSATAHAATQAGGRVAFCECDADGNFNVEDAIARIGPDTAAVVVVHIAGFVPRGFRHLVDECQRRGVALIEDCAHAHGAKMQGREVGSFGDAGCFSFYPTKITTCGTGGMVTTNRADVYEMGRSLRHHGQGRSLEEIVAIGSDWLMPEHSAVLCRAQLRRLDDIIKHRLAVAAAYDAAIVASADKRFSAPCVAPETEPVYYKYPVSLAAPLDARHVRRHMTAAGIDTGALYWPPVQRMPVFAALGVTMPFTDSVLIRRLCLPMHGLVDPADCPEIVSVLQTCLDEVATCRAPECQG